MTGHVTPVTVVEFYWRPGCPYCGALRGPLRRSGVPPREVNIWDDRQAAARVRSVAGGSETVPTVFVGSHVMVNPSLGQVLTAVREHAPNLEVGGEPTGGRWQPIAAVLTVAVLWLVLAARSPTTTYHLAPVLMAAAAPVARRLHTGTPVSSRTALALAIGGLALTLATIGMIGWLWGMAGPDLSGGAASIMESVLFAVLGAAVGWWWARRGNRNR